MFYVQRDAHSQLRRVEVVPFEGMSDTLTADSEEIRAWFANQNVESSLLQLKQSDLDMIRVVDDLVHLLISKGLIRITDLPPAAQTKLLTRSQARESLSGLHRLINDEERGII
ncbi:tryptophan synthase subunit beta [Pseudomonas sp. HMWF032]|uniref:tryptophan synthase subunit beta n=1 Tax=unclassified Pseudomonas TaxID=196821 RepID=UPI000D3476CE|nr:MULTISPECIES: tryptophan synthase subunit beta [unclassified Pseudomonas]PTS82690.1 tryptophan synthase subunit beta [Pseudomonas sp. HMWF032]PTT82323.1 tryptophan synthase subunit beta [Pseudomonas sp. HMWF010]WAC43553.1 tryptophan synthase subunit beta [Pseudomonas sp. SL4(2022)]